MLSELHEASSIEITEETLIEGSTVPVSMLVGRFHVLAFHFS